VSARVIGASEARGRWFLRIAVLAIGVYATSALLDHIGVRRTERLTATLLSPNSAATVFGGGVLLAIAATANRLRRQQGLAMLKRGDPEAVAALGVAAVLVVTLLLTASRAGLAATLVGLGLFLVWEAIAQRQRLRVAAGLGLPGCRLGRRRSGPTQRKSGDRAARSGWAGRFHS
jgi:O-antigen ligase